MPPRVAYFGTPRFAVPALTALIGANHHVVGVVTQPDRPRGRGQHVSSSPVKMVAEEHRIPTLQPTRLRDAAFVDVFRAWQPDIAVVAAYGRLLPQAVLDIPRRGFINIHASLLPRWRGAAPIHRAILAGDTVTGITIMRVVLALDAGPSIARVSIDIDADETSDALEARLSAAGADLLIQTIDDVIEERAVEIPQDESGVTHAARVDRRDSPIDWSRPAALIHNQIRGLHPWPLAETHLGGRRVIVRRSHVESTDAAHAAPGTIVEAVHDRLIIATGAGSLRLTELQPEGRRAMDARAFINGVHVHAGLRFDAPAASA